MNDVVCVRVHLATKHDPSPRNDVLAIPQKADFIYIVVDAAGIVHRTEGRGVHASMPLVAMPHFGHGAVFEDLGVQLDMGANGWA